jgi:chorismate synthase
VSVASHVTGIGPVTVPDDPPVPFDRIRAIPEDSPLHCADTEVEARMIAAIDRAREAGDTLGGSFEVVAHGVPAGLGSYTQWDRKLDGRLAQAMMSIHAIKGVAIGIGAGAARRPGSQVHDEITLRGSAGASAGADASGEDLAIVRPTNRAGGLEGGVTNGEDVRVTGFMKPISTLMKPLRSVDLTTFEEAPAAIERSDVCAVTAAAVVGEAMVCFVLADALLDRFGGDSIRQLEHNVREITRQLGKRLRRQAHLTPEP